MTIDTGKKESAPTLRQFLPRRAEILTNQISALKGELSRLERELACVRNARKASEDEQA
jgi:hypothetical protein